MNTKHFGIILPIILISYFVSLLDNSIVFTSTVSIARDLNMTTATLAWVTNAYALTFGGLLLLGGRLGDLFGRKVVFVIGLAIFGVGSLIVGASPSAGIIIAARAFQGIGSAVLAPTTLALLLDSYTGAMRTKAISYYGATAGIGASVGLVFGGWVTATFSWRVGFLINVPVVLGLLIISVLVIPSKSANTSHQRVDVLGAILSVIGLSALVYAIDGSVGRLISLMVGIVGIALFILREAKTSLPIMPLKIFADRQRANAGVGRFFYAGSSLAFFFLTPQLLQRALGYTPLAAGVAFLPMTILIFVCSLQVSRLTEKLGNTRLLVLGTFITMIGFLLSALIDIQHGYWLAIGIPMMLLGVGQGFTMSPLTAAGVANTSADIAGSASGVVNTVHQIGGSVGMSLIVAMTSRITPIGTSFRWATLGMALLALITLITAMNISAGERHQRK